MEQSRRKWRRCALGIRTNLPPHWTRHQNETLLCLTKVTLQKQNRCLRRNNDNCFWARIASSVHCFDQDRMTKPGMLPSDAYPGIFGGILCIKKRTRNQSNQTWNFRWGIGPSLSELSMYISVISISQSPQTRLGNTWAHCDSMKILSLGISQTYPIQWRTSASILVADTSTSILRQRRSSMTRLRLAHTGLSSMETMRQANYMEQSESRRILARSRAHQAAMGTM